MPNMNVLAQPQKITQYARCDFYGYLIVNGSARRKKRNDWCRDFVSTSFVFNLLVWQSKC